MIIEEFLDLLNLIKAQTLYVYKLLEIIVID